MQTPSNASDLGLKGAEKMDPVLQAQMLQQVVLGNLKKQPYINDEHSRASVTLMLTPFFTRKQPSDHSAFLSEIEGSPSASALQTFLRDHPFVAPNRLLITYADGTPVSETARHHIPPWTAAYVVFSVGEFVHPTKTNASCAFTPVRIVLAWTAGSDMWKAADEEPAEAGPVFDMSTLTPAERTLMLCGMAPKTLIDRMDAPLAITAASVASAAPVIVAPVVNIAIGAGPDDEDALWEQEETAALLEMEQEEERNRGAKRRLVEDEEEEVLPVQKHKKKSK